MRTRPVVLIGPTRPDNVEAIERVLEDRWRVTHSSDRTTFARDLRAAKARLVVLSDVDRDGVPNAPLLEHCARRRMVEMVVLVHESPVIRLPSSWANTSLVVAHVMLGGISFVDAGLKIAEQLRRDVV